MSVRDLVREALIEAAVLERKAATPKDVDRWPALPGQTRGDAKDPLIRILEAGFNPERFREDPEYQARPEIQALGEKWLRIASEREKAALEAERRSSTAQADFEANREQLLAEEQRQRIEQQIAALQESLSRIPPPRGPEPEPADE